MNMHFLNPLALWSLGLLPVVVLLHLLQPPRQSYWVSNAYLWPGAQEERTARWRFIRRRPRASLVLQLLFLTIVTLALAQPVLSRRQVVAWRVAFIFDASASMHALEGGRSRFDLARERALGILAQLEQGDEVMMIQAGAQPVMAGDFVADQNILRRTILGLVPSHAPADLTSAVLLALPIADAIYLFSDGAANATLPPALQVDKVHYVQVGESDNNLAVSRLDVRRNPFSPYDQELFVEVVNLSKQPHKARVVLAIDTETLREDTVTLQPGARRAFVTGMLSARQGIATVTIDAPDHLAVDNYAYAVLPPPRSTAILVVSNGNRFVDTALDQNPLYERTTLSPSAYARGDVPADFDVVIFDGVAPQPGLPPGRYVMINPQPANARSMQASISAPHPRHPIMAFIDPAAMVIDRGAPPGVSPGATVLLEAAGQPLLVADEQPGRKTVTFGFDLHDSNLPLTAAFPILMSNILHWLTAPHAPAQTHITTGEPLYWEFPHPGPHPITITTPQGTTVRKELSDHALVFEATDMTGIYTLHGQGVTQRFAVNLNNAEESNIRPVFRPETGLTALSRVALPSHQGQVGLWQYLLGAALLILVVEWGYICRIVPSSVNKAPHSGNRLNA